MKILALSAVAVLVPTAVAVAKTNTLTGKLTGFGQTNAKITLKIETDKNGVARRATAINVTGFKAKCYDAAGNVTGPGKTVSAKLGSFRVQKRSLESGGFSWQILVRSRIVDGNDFWPLITLGSKKGRSASGGISYKYPHPDYPVPAPNVRAPVCAGQGRIKAEVKK